jgi:hypothetical protein
MPAGLPAFFIYVFSWCATIWLILRRTLVGSYRYAAKPFYINYELSLEQEVASTQLLAEI